MLRVGAKVVPESRPGGCPTEVEKKTSCFGGAGKQWQREGSHVAPALQTLTAKVVE